MDENWKGLVPTHDKLLIPTLEVLKSLGGSGSIQEISEKVSETVGMSEDTLNISHKEGSSQSEFDYRLAWARTYLKKYGLIDNSARGIWFLVDKDIDPKNYQPTEIVKSVVKNEILRKKTQLEDDSDVVIEDEIGELDWKDKLLKVLQNMDPSAFERLSKLLLRESGFVQVEVTGRSGDGGIDGKGILRLNGLLSFHVFFQCKRFKDSVASSYIRDFRGAMQGRADKGLFITTGKFTRDAVKEATRDGAPPIDMIDGDLLCEKLKEFNLGVKTELIEEVTIASEWFEKI